MSTQLTKWRSLIRKLEETYGIDYGVGENEMDLPQNLDELEDAWFICPECGELIYWSDWKFNDQLSISCPICEYEYEF